MKPPVKVRRMRATNPDSTRSSAARGQSVARRQQRRTKQAHNAGRK